MAGKKLRTPIIKPRTQGGTFYTFASSMEDIGLNINERKNKVSLSHYVVLNIPSFNIDPSLYGDVPNEGDYTFAAQLENYAMNMESVVRNQPSYNFSTSRTVSERIFWKFLQQHYGLTFEKEDSGYYVESSNTDIIQGFGQITAGAQRSDAYGIYNETFVQIPSSYGKMKVLFSPIQDTNYYIKENGYQASNPDGKLEYISDDEIDGQGRLHTGITANALYDDTSTRTYEVADDTDKLCAVFSLSDLRAYYENPLLTYDDIGIDSSVEQYNFNAILVYYSIYDSTGENILATNAYGLLILDSAAPDQVTSGKYAFPSIVKRKTTAATSGLSYAFRLNIKASSVYSGDTVIEDESTGGYVMGSEFNDMLRNLDRAVEILKSNANIISTISSDNQIIKKLATDSIDKIESIEKDIANLKNGKKRNLNAATIKSDTAEIRSLKSNVGIYNDTDAEPIGELGSEELKYKKATFGELGAETISVNKTCTPKLYAKGNELHISDEMGASPFAKINEKGVTSEGSFYAANNPDTDTQMSGAIDFLKTIKVCMDDSGHISLQLPDKSAAINPLLLDAVSGKDSVNVSNLLYIILSALTNSAE